MLAWERHFVKYPPKFIIEAQLLAITNVRLESLYKAHTGGGPVSPVESYLPWIEKEVKTEEEEREDLVQSVLQGVTF